MGQKLPDPAKKQDAEQAQYRLQTRAKKAAGKTGGAILMM